MKDRILSFLQKESLSPSKFADEIGVQRSNISHILSGRNNPGFDFIQKMLSRYPKINAEWLIMGTGSMFKDQMINTLFTENSTTTKEGDLKGLFPPAGSNEFITQQSPEIHQKSSVTETITPTGASFEKKPVQIVVLYSDGTFRAYKPD